MVFNSAYPDHICYDDHDDRDDPNINTAITPPTTVAEDRLDDRDPIGGASHFLVPWPGFTFIIRSISSGKTLTLLDGQIMLAQPGGHGSIHWACVEIKGWLGFRNVISGKFLGHDKTG